MPDVNVPPGYGIITYRWTHDESVEEISTTIGIEVVGTMGTPDVADAAFASITTAAGFCPANHMGDKVRFLGAKAYVMTVGGPTVAFSSQTSIAGTVAINTPILNFAILVQKKTAFVGRKYRGRMFFPPINADESNINAYGRLTTAFQLVAQDYADELLEELDSNGIPARLLHSDPALTPHVITQLLVPSAGATQRRRLR